MLGKQSIGRGIAPGCQTLRHLTMELVTCTTFIQPKILEILVKNQIEQTILVWSDWNIKDHL